MDRAELVGRLREAGVPEAFYEIAGASDATGRPDAYYFLRREADMWVVGLSERSRDEVLRRFAAEDEACVYLHEALTRTPDPAAGQGGPAELLDDLLADSAESRQRAWEDFYRADEHDSGA
ncbi:hypothetical protein [Streptomyces sp. NPDC086787]|uniref:hypothetical protein n=1 Tax=Streptomyces sp. NPDC086787 TaxID=3365759 RepID=UPI0037FEA553